MGALRPRLRVAPPPCAAPVGSLVISCRENRAWGMTVVADDSGTVMAHDARTAVAAALPLDILHGVATVAFLAAIWLPWGRALRRAVTKYGL